MRAEVLELAGNATKDLRVKRVIPRHIMLAVRGDEELDTFCNDVIIADGGYVLHTLARFHMHTHMYMLRKAHTKASATTQHSL